VAVSLCDFIGTGRMILSVPAGEATHPTIALKDLLTIIRKEPLTISMKDLLDICT